jgi:hypothetical protein
MCRPRGHALDLLVGEVVKLAEPVGFAFRLGERLGLFRRKRLRLALRFTLLVAGFSD